MTSPHLGPLGTWGHESLFDPQLARDLESYGYSAIWLGGSPAADLAAVEPLLAATENLVVATGIVNIWSADARAVAASHRRITAAFPGRFLLGIGVGHPEATSDYRRPYGSLVDYLDVLDDEGVPAEERVLAALGPKVLRLARDRSAGAHPYLVPPEHTRQAREILGADRVLAPEQKVVLDTDATAARELGRGAVDDPYLHLSNYVSNLKRLGWADADIADRGSDALIDALVGHGDAAAVAQRLQGHRAAGADQVLVQLLTPEGADRRAGYAAIADAFGR
ncbi:probable F420-dependent oxidoreductase, MSMEG_4141 family [Jatrophihabitans endophyticus]|uniref:Probable F420-dependent oxidoreductase, MSMEG_4141 family n=1 Tax=Jatrophihabitans endophyticus TaxID=1206085 RepID=A0A1M5HK04_9ACTN|nr:LLM class F420-dependent oxidoreductase [Jatrophihabitans endophyticus]SHG16265.1 probable F420-dependent oxidoreductase, MSMEG_4141 family [Jatrophihabitans endophyticus]